MVRIESGQADDVVVLKDGRCFHADVIIGADGKDALVRNVLQLQLANLGIRTLVQNARFRSG